MRLRRLWSRFNSCCRNVRTREIRDKTALFTKSLANTSKYVLKSAPAADTLEVAAGIPPHSRGWTGPAEYDLAPGHFFPTRHFEQGPARILTHSVCERVEKVTTGMDENDRSCADIARSTPRSIQRRARRRHRLCVKARNEGRSTPPTTRRRKTRRRTATSTCEPVGNAHASYSNATLQTSFLASQVMSERFG